MKYRAQNPLFRKISEQKLKLSAHIYPLSEIWSWSSENFGCLSKNCKCLPPTLTHDTNVNFPGTYPQQEI